MGCFDVFWWCSRSSLVVQLIKAVGLVLYLFDIVSGSFDFGC